MIHKTTSDISHTMRVKTYPNGTKILQCCASPIFREPGWEASESVEICRLDRNGQDEDLKRSRRRAAAKVFDIAYSNDFSYFVTLTLDSEKIDRYDISVIVKSLNIWLDNRVRRNGLCYVLVPERHKDGAIHFHGFFNDALPVVSSGTYSVPGFKKPKKPRSKKQLAEWLEAGAHEVFNLPSWSFGFTTAIELYGERLAACRYICKYITKSDGGKVGGRWYYSGGKLAAPVFTYFDADINDFLQIDGVTNFHLDRLGVDIYEVIV